MKNKQLQSFDKAVIDIFIWDNVKKPIGVIQLIHGSLEYASRYIEMIKYLNKSGYIVVADDHRGHGKSHKDQLGHVGKNISYKDIVKDLIEVNKFIQETFPKQKIIIYGHSWGSLLERVLISKKDIKVNGAIISGTGIENKAATVPALILLRLYKLFKGDAHYPKLVHKISFDKFEKRFKKENMNGMGWLSDSKKSNLKFYNDPLRGKMFSVAGFRTLIGSMQAACYRKTINKTSKDLPILIISGSLDPVGNFSKGISKFAKTLEKKKFKDVTKILYENHRHEIHNGSAKKQVFKDIKSWAKRVTL